MKKKINDSNILIVNIQAILTLLLIITLIISLFNHHVWVIFRFVLGITLLFLAYANSRIYKRKGYTPAYIISGILVIILNILNMLGIF